MKTIIRSILPAIKSCFRIFHPEPPIETAWIHPAIRHIHRSKLGTGIIFIGSPGSGKTAVLLPYILEMKNTGQKLMTLDVKGETYQKLGIPQIAPWQHFSLIPDIGYDTVGKADAQMFADIYIPVPESGKDKIWAASANSILAANVESLTISKPLRWTWLDLAAKAEETIEQWHATMVKIDPANAKILEGAEETSSSVAFNVATSLRSLKTIANMFEEARKFGGRMFSVRGWLYDKDYPIKQLILRSDDKHAAVVGFILTYIMEYVCRSISNLPPNSDDPKNLFFDEIAQVPAVHSLAKALEIGRQYGFNTIIATQDWNQIRMKYGKEAADIFLTTTTTKIIGMTSPGIGTNSMQIEASQMLGTRDVSVFNASHSSGGNASGSAPSISTSYQEKSMPLLLPSELESRLGPHGSRPNPRPNPPPGQETIPTHIKAILKPSDGNGYLLNWPIITFKDVKKTPRTLPSHHFCNGLARMYMNTPNRSPAENFIALMADPLFKMTKLEQLDFLYSGDHITRKEWLKAIANPAEAEKALQAFIHPPRAVNKTEARTLPTASTERHEGPLNPSMQADGLGISEALQITGAIVALGIEKIIQSEPMEKFEGLHAEPETAKADEETKSEADQSDELAPAALSLIAPNSEVLHTIEIASHVIDALEILGPKQSPAAIVKHEPPTPPAAGLPIPSQDPKAKLAALQKRMQRR